MEAPLLSVRQLTVDFNTDAGNFRAVDGLTLDIPKGKTVALVGESGSGKSVTAQAILQILSKKARITSGSIVFNDPANGGSVDIAALQPESDTMHALRGGRIAMIFQEPMTSLSPLHTIGDQISEALMIHADVDQAKANQRTMDVLARVGFPDPKRALNTYPFELSGGLRQRAMIAMALITRPALLIADEPTTALDVTTQAQILDLIKELQVETGMSVLLITRSGRRGQCGRRGRGDVSREDHGGRLSGEHLPQRAACLPPGTHARGSALRHGGKRTPDADP
jgi:peptide/nickel transport system ATP-binding protein